jgi:hypothetical protein
LRTIALAHSIIIDLKDLLSRPFMDFLFLTWTVDFEHTNDVPTEGIPGNIDELS